MRNVLRTTLKDGLGRPRLITSLTRAKQSRARRLHAPPGVHPVDALSPGDTPRPAEWSPTQGIGRAPHGRGQRGWPSVKRPAERRARDRPAAGPFSGRRAASRRKDSDVGSSGRDPDRRPCRHRSASDTRHCRTSGRAGGAAPSPLVLVRAARTAIRAGGNVRASRDGNGHPCSVQSLPQLAAPATAKTAPLNAPLHAPPVPNSYGQRGSLP
jgi:hypothetical protein